MKKILVIIICIICICGCSKNEDVESSAVIPSESSSLEISFVIEESDKTEPDVMEILPEPLYKKENIGVIIEHYSNISEEDRTAIVDGWYFPTDFKVHRNTDNQQEGDILISGKYEKFIPRINNHLPLTELITEEAPLRFLGPFLRYSYGWSRGVTFGMMCEGMGSSIPLNFFRQVDENHYYTVVKLKDAGYMYVFYETFDNAVDKTDITDVGAVYIEQTLSYKNFENISVGSSIDDIRAIDSGIYAWELAREFLYDDCRTDPYNKDCLPGTTQPCDYNSMVSIHLLEDGLLTIVYEKEGDTWIITNMNFSEDFIFDSSITPYSEIIPKKQFKILEQDYPPAS